MEDKRGKDVLAPHLQQIMRRIHATMGGEESDVIGMDPDGFMMDMPLSNILDFHHDNISPLPEDLVDKLLSQVHGSD